MSTPTKILYRLDKSLRILSRNGRPGVPGGQKSYFPESEVVDLIQVTKDLISQLGGGGTSNYQLWLNQGNTGSEQDYLDTLVGAGINNYTSEINFGGEETIRAYVRSSGAVNPHFSFNLANGVLTITATAQVVINSVTVFVPDGKATYSEGFFVGAFKIEIIEQNGVPDAIRHFDVIDGTNDGNGASASDGPMQVYSGSIPRYVIREGNKNSYIADRIDELSTGGTFITIN